MIIIRYQPIPNFVTEIDLFLVTQVLHTQANWYNAYTFIHFFRFLFTQAKYFHASTIILHGDYFVAICDSDALGKDSSILLGQFH